ncbi:MAG: formate dehydrogenase accessory sulfurtransferase FdhD [Acidimicrobiia bacterium]|nr:formate dehydrogenase accessory sulfurtransferase FdhD [Acidimicrobiia bacterium]
MVRSRSESVLARRIDGTSSGRRPDAVIVEEPLAIWLDDVQVSSTMRTPGHDFELAAGFLFGEGALDGAPVTGIRYCRTAAPTDSDFNVVSVETGGKAPIPTPRLGSTTSSCGLCGSEAIAELTERVGLLARYEPWDLDVLRTAPEALLDSQPLFDATGGVHAAAAIDRAGAPVLVREDIGRHNAVDKVVGRLLLDDSLPAGDLALVVSGRGSFEMVQKAWAAGFSALVAVSAPSALAVATARRAGLTLVGFARGGAANVYSPDHLI